MRSPKGIKTRKSVSKRFKITGTGKVTRRGAGRRHLLAGRTPSAVGRCEERRSSDQRTSVASSRIAIQPLT